MNMAIIDCILITEGIFAVICGILTVYVTVDCWITKNRKKKEADNGRNDIIKKGG